MGCKEWGAGGEEGRDWDWYVNKIVTIFFYKIYSDHEKPSSNNLRVKISTATQRYLP